MERVANELERIHLQRGIPIERDKNHKHMCVSVCCACVCVGVIVSGALSRVDSNRFAAEYPNRPMGKDKVQRNEN